MQPNDLGQITQTFRTSRIQAVILFIVGLLVAGVAGFLWSIDDNHNLLPVTLIAAGGAVEERSVVAHAKAHVGPFHSAVAEVAVNQCEFG